MREDGVRSEEEASRRRNPIGSVLLAARSNHVDVTIQVTDTSQEGQHPDLL